MHWSTQPVTPGQSRGDRASFCWLKASNGVGKARPRLVSQGGPYTPEFPSGVPVSVLSECGTLAPQLRLPSRSEGQEAGQGGPQR